MPRITTLTETRIKRAKGSAKELMAALISTLAKLILPH